jgi:hypothetical protein
MPGTCSATDYTSGPKTQSFIISQLIFLFWYYHHYYPLQINWFLTEFMKIPKRYVDWI